MNKIETRIIKSVNEHRASSLRKINKGDKILAKLTKMQREKRSK